MRGDTVECLLIERSELHQSLGIKVMRRYPRFVFRDGLLVERSSWKPSPDVRKLEMQMAGFHSWVRAYHPDKARRLGDPKRPFIYSRETGRMVRELAKEYRVVTQGTAKQQK